MGAKPPLSLQEKTQEKTHFEGVDPQNFPLRGIEHPRFTDTYNIAHSSTESDIEATANSIVQRVHKKIIDCIF